MTLKNFPDASFHAFNLPSIEGSRCSGFCIADSTSSSVTRCSRILFLACLTYFIGFNKKNDIRCPFRLQAGARGCVSGVTIFPLRYALCPLPYALMGTFGASCGFILLADMANGKVEALNQRGIVKDSIDTLISNRRIRVLWRAEGSIWHPDSG